MAVVVKNSVNKKIGVCYDIQIVDDIPTEETDIKLDFLVTENEVFTFN